MTLRDAPPPAAGPATAARSSEIENGFVRPDFSAPVDLDAYWTSLPEDHTVKGMFFDAVIRQARERAGAAPGRASYLAFKDYPLREFLEVLIECARAAYPDEPLREGLRQMGRTIYPAFTNSLIGRVLFKVAGTNVRMALRAVPRAYSSVSDFATAEVELLDDSSTIVRLRNAWDVPDAYEVGVFEGGLEALGHDGTIEVRMHSLCDCDLKIRWWPKPAPV